MLGRSVARLPSCRLPSCREAFSCVLTKPLFCRPLQAYLDSIPLDGAEPPVDDPPEDEDTVSEGSSQVPWERDLGMPWQLMLDYLLLTRLDPGNLLRLRTQSRRAAQSLPCPPRLPCALDKRHSVQNLSCPLRTHCNVQRGLL